MSYVIRDETDKIITQYSTAQYCENYINVLSATCENKLITINLETAYPLYESAITTAIISGANEYFYNGKFLITRISDTQFTYTILKDEATTATGTIKINFALEYLADDNQEILDLQAKLADLVTISNKKAELIASNHKIILHNEEIAAETTEENRTLTQTEFNTLHTERNILRSEIDALEQKHGL